MSVVEFFMGFIAFVLVGVTGYVFGFKYGVWWTLAKLKEKNT